MQISVGRGGDREPAEDYRPAEVWPRKRRRSPRLVLPPGATPAGRAGRSYAMLADFAAIQDLVVWSEGSN